MGVSTAIAWTDHTFNPWWGCERVSPGCQHCYAEAFDKRVGGAHWGKQSERRFFGKKHWDEPLKWNAAAAAAGRPALVFCASMADVFEDRSELDEWRSILWQLIADTPWLTWQLLTKRPQNVLRMVPSPWVLGMPAPRPLAAPGSVFGWPENVWIGTTAEDQQRADERIPVLLDIRAPVRFLSCEPLLGPVDLSTAFWRQRVVLGIGQRLTEPFTTKRTVDWVICGGESGAGHRPLDLDHARLLRDQCEAAAVPFFFKQVGGRTPHAGGDLLDGREHKEFPSCHAA